MIKVEAAQRITAADNEVTEAELDRLYKAIGFSPRKHTYDDEGTTATTPHNGTILRLNAATLTKLAAAVAKNKKLTLEFFKDGDEAGVRVTGVTIKPREY